MATTYTVKPGDYLAKIAEDHGFFDPQTIWQHGDNADLRALRDNPNVLLPGDKLHIPDKRKRVETKPTDALHRFRVKRGKNLLRLILEDMYGKPLANAPCELTVDGTVFQVVSGGDGKIEQAIALTAQKAQLLVKDGKSALHGVTLDIQIGHLDPVSERSGQAARLSNLGYFLGALDAAGDDASDAAFRSAVEEFQCDHGLAVDGDCGAQTQAKLLSVHGS
jgi:Putative peptidoglycan binding domain/LysM domain